ncbi:AraC family transcriptional regulator [Mucilaginibacter sp. JRF]|uniref:helix-turn-helix domain-containing protein n=1 Tax=Mucilaginibacter sp. JRF TaxID=2780088 RepID=UPI00187F6EAE|nr:helix-turn-helix domain-containing protein [Mucilaginibacter sp. JRF]MBE9583270.1 AraC family transcriptional regulator [Mucilaginibacter sp. JRF]
MENSVKSVPVISIGDINDSSGNECLGNQFHVIRSDEMIGTPSYQKPVKGDHFTFLLALAGVTKMKYNLLDYELLPNDLFIISPGIIHEFHTGTDGQILGAGFTRAFFTSTLIHKKHVNVFNFLLTNHNPHFKLSPEEAHTLQNLMLMLKKSHADKAHNFKEDLMFHGFNLFMLEAADIFGKQRGDTGGRFTRKEELLMNFLKLLSINFNIHRSVQFYADKIFVTSKHLTKTVKELTGKTVGQLIDEMVIAEAKILLDTPSLTIGDVAAQLNFSNQFFFSKFFKNQTGLTPSQFKMNLSQ